VETVPSAGAGGAVNPGAGDAFRCEAFPASGYYLLAQRAGRLIADFGGPGSMENPGHAHAGIFSFEISCPRGRVAVDGGTFSYEYGKERLRARGTAAHNTVRVGGRDQFDLWGAFRVGRRAQVHDLEWRPESGAARLSAWHDGYRRLGVRHRRTIVSVADLGWLIADELEGEGEHLVESFLHLAPEIAPETDGEVTELDPLGWTVAVLRGPAFRPHADSYSPRLGERLPACTLACREQPRLPVRRLYWMAPLPPQQLRWEEGGDGFLLTAEGRRRQVEI